MNSECRGYTYHLRVFCLLLAAVVFLAGCTDVEQAKAEHVKKGEAYLTELKYQEASLEFRNAIQFDEQFAQAHWGLARAFEGLERFPEMIDELRKVVTYDKNNLDARVKLGNYYLVGNRGRADILAEAEQLAKDVLAKDPNHIEGHILMGGLLFANGDKDKAFAELNKAIELDRNRVESYLSLALFYMRNKEVEKAEDLYKRAISVNPNSAVVRTEYGKFLTQNNRPAEAEAELLKAVEVGPTDRNARFVLASYYLVNRRFDKAEESYKLLADLQPDKPESQSVLADFYSAIGRNDEAVKIYQDIVSKSPDYVQGRYRLGEILLARGDAQGANAQIEEVLKKDKNDRQALLLRARMREQSGHPDNLKSAIEDLNNVLGQEPNSRMALYFMAKIQFTMGQLDQARTYAANLEKSYPDYLPAKLMQLQLTLGTGDYKGAMALANDLFTRLDKTAPDRENSPQLMAEIREKAHLTRGIAQLQLKNLAGARQDFENARSIKPYDPVVYNSLALVSLSENNPQEATALFESAIKVDATNYDALNGLINLYAKNNQLEKAHAQIDQALAKYPNMAALHFLKGQVYGYQHDSANVQAEFNKAIALDPNYLPAYNGLASLYINSSQQDRAILEYQKIIALSPDNPTPYTMIAILEFERKNYDAAAENYRKALDKDPNFTVAANNLAWLYADTGRGNLDEAMRLAQAVVQKNPNVAGFLDTLGWVYYKKNLHAAAIDQFRKAVSLNEAEARARNASPSATFRYHLGMALKGLGNMEESRRELQAAIKLSEKAPFPYLDEAKKALATM